MRNPFSVFRSWGQSPDFMPAAARTGIFFSHTNQMTAIRHYQAGTWPARLWAVLALGHAENSQSTGQQEQENDSPLNPGCERAIRRPAMAVIVSVQFTTDNDSGAAVSTKPIRRGLSLRSASRDVEIRADIHSQDSEDFGFSFLSHFMRRRLDWLRRVALLFFGGIVFVFCSFFPF